MAIKRQDEVLAKAVASDAAVIPRYDIKRPDGTKVAENVALELKNTVVNEGTAVNKQLLDEILAASGTAGGTTSALTLAQEGFALVDGAVVRMKSTYNLAGGATLNVNGTGAKHICTSWGEEVDTGIVAGVWMVLIYSSALDGYVIVNQTRKRRVVTDIITQTQSWTCPAGVTSIHVRLFGGGAGGRAAGSSSGGNGGNGGGGGHMSAQMLNVTPGTIYPVTIGKGGESNRAGGTTSFGTLLSANGAYDNDGGTGGGGAGASNATYSHGNDGGDGDYGGGGGAGGGYGGNGTPGLPGTGGNGNNGASGNGTRGGNGGNGMAGGGGTGKGGTANQAGGGGGGYGGEGGTGNRGGGGGGGYGVAGKGGNGGESGYPGSDGALGGGGGGGGQSSESSGGKGGDGVAVITYTVEE